MEYNFPNWSIGDRRVLSGWEARDRYKWRAGDLPAVHHFLQRTRWTLSVCTHQGGNLSNKSGPVEFREGCWRRMGDVIYTIRLSECPDLAGVCKWSWWVTGPWSCDIYSQTGPAMRDSKSVWITWIASSNCWVLRWTCMCRTLWW